MHLQESGEMYLETILVLSRRLNKVRSVDVDGGVAVDGAGDRGNYGVDLGHVAYAEGRKHSEQ